GGSCSTPTGGTAAPACTGDHPTRPRSCAGRRSGPGAGRRRRRADTDRGPRRPRKIGGGPGTSRRRPQGGRGGPGPGAGAPHPAGGPLARPPGPTPDARYGLGRTGHELRILGRCVSRAAAAAVARGPVRLGLAAEPPLLALLYDFGPGGPRGGAPFVW